MRAGITYVKEPASIQPWIDESDVVMLRRELSVLVLPPTFRMVGEDYLIIAVKRRDT